MGKTCETCKQYASIHANGGICNIRHGYAGADWECRWYKPKEQQDAGDEMPEGVVVVKADSGEVIAEKELITTLNGYQRAAMRTCMETCYNIPYMLINLQGEVGELSSKIAKAIRKEQIWFEGDENGWLNVAKQKMTIEEHTDLELGLKGELGDVLWQLSGLCEVLGFSLQEVAEYNIQKLASRKQRGVIDGDGDNR